MNRRLYLVALWIVAACGFRSAPNSTSDSAADAADQCGTANANTLCESEEWPELIIAFGDPGASKLSYAAHAAPGLASGQIPCNSGKGESASIHCDVGFSGEGSYLALEIRADDAGPPLVSTDVTLGPPNFCGKARAYVVVTTADAAVPQVSVPKYVDVCGPL